MQTSPLINHLLDYLGEDSDSEATLNNTTLLRHAQIAQEWLLTHYLRAWLELVGALVECKYPVALRHQVQLRALARLAETVDSNSSVAEQHLLLESIHTYLRSTLKIMNGLPTERSMQWGVWANEVALSIAYGFSETDFLDAMICQSIAPCCMYASFLVSQVVEDEGVASEISSKMFEQKPRALLELLRRAPVAPEA